MKPAAIGMRVHSGWAAMVAIGFEGKSPRVLWRGRPHLVETFTFEFRQPYHTAEKLSIDEAGAVIAQARDTATRLARKAIEDVRLAIHPHGFELNRCCLLLASGKPLPALEKILASHALIHTADGELFRQSILEAGKQAGLETFTIQERTLLPTASGVLKLPADELLRRAAALGASHGSPWTQDEKLSALAAWMSLVSNAAFVMPGSSSRG
ncbi:MAG TPA: hypothetical protein VLZ50_09215 [Terracidiphilus sp.]|nr:hypothetical protein [Terracidiphilus sp.]